MFPIYNINLSASALDFPLHYIVIVVKRPFWFVLYFSGILSSVDSGTVWVQLPVVVVSDEYDVSPEWQSYVAKTNTHMLKGCKN